MRNEESYYKKREMQVSPWKRLEDLGRITEKLDNILDLDAMIDLGDYRDSEQFANAMSDFDKAEEFFRNMSFVREKLYDVWNLAKWGDGDE